MDPATGESSQSSGVMEPATSENLQSSGVMEPGMSENLQSSSVIEPATNESLNDSGGVEPIMSEKLQDSGVMEPTTSEHSHNAGGMEPVTTENLQSSTTLETPVDQNHDNLDSDVLNNGGMEPQHELKEEDMEPQLEFKEEDIRSIVEVIAATGKFWLDWDKLKRMLSFYLKQVLSEYPAAKSTSEQQSSSLGETFPDMAKRLDAALNSFIEGPPFTIQRVCEILLHARTTYPNPSKLAVALEKNLLVTSTLTISTEPYPAVQKSSTVEAGTDDPPTTNTNQVENGDKPTIGDADEIMAEVEEADVNDDMTMDMETFEDIVRSSESNPVPSGES